MTYNSKLFAAAMSVGIFTIPSAVRATVFFQDNFSTDNDVFAYPDTSASHLPTTTSGTGSWVLNDVNTSQMQAGVITNTLPAGGTGGADGNTHYMAITRSGGTGDADAIFSSPAPTVGNLSVQWDMYDVGPGRNWEIFLTDAQGNSGNTGPLIEASYFSPPSSTDMEIGTRTGPSATYNDTGGFPTNSWVHMDMEVNLSAETYQLFINNALVVEPSSGQSTWAYVNTGTVGPFESLIFDGASNQGETLYVDNVNVGFTPVGGPPQWVPNASGDWNLAADWNGGVVPNGIGAEADFFGAITSNHTVFTDAPITAGIINFNNSNTYQVTGTGSLTLQTSSGSATVIVQSGTQSINLPLTIASNTTFNVSSGATLVVSNPVTVDAGDSLTAIGTGTVTYQSTVSLGTGASLALASSTYVHALTLAANATTSIISSSSTNRLLLQTDSLSLASGASLNLATSDLIVHGGNLATVNGLVASGYNGGTQSGAGIHSSAAAANTTHLTTLGVIANNDGQGNPLYGSGTALGLFDGTSPAVGDVLVKYTYFGDANLDGKVDGSDYSRIDAGFLSHATGWANGDFNYDGVVNGSDYTLIDNAFNTQGGPIASAAGIVAASTAQIAGTSSVPEPGTLSLVFVAAGLLGRRRARK